MAKKRLSGAIHLLQPRQVLSASPTCELSDGGGLLLQVRDRGASWVLRYTSPSGKRREMGLGPAPRATLAQAGETLVAAREMAQRAREQVRQGVDPIEARDAAKAARQQAEGDHKAKATRERWTLARCARDYHERVIEPSRTTKHAAQWIASLENHVPAALWHAPIDSIAAPALLSALLDVTPHERARNVRGDRLPETVQRIRQRLDAIFEDAAFHGRASANPAAAIKRKMREASGRRPRGEFRALSFREAPALMRALRAAPGTAARALELAVLTVARTTEVLLAEWQEFDIDAATWTVPAARMKVKESHTVFLSGRAVDVLRAQLGQDGRYVFPSPMTVDAADGQRKPLSNMAMLTALNRLAYRDRTTVHGLARATFSTWANETGAGRPDVIEACLAHEEGNRVRAAYNRAQFNDERRALLASWSDYLDREPAQVIDLESKRA